MLYFFCVCIGLLSIQKDEKDAIGKAVAEENAITHWFSPATILHSSSLKSRAELQIGNYKRVKLSWY